MAIDKHILVVEDDQDGQDVIAHILEYMQMRPSVAANAEQAIELLAAPDKAFDAVIIDLALPGKDGWELLSHIRSTPAIAHIACVVVTAFHTWKLREQAIAAGFDAYFPKPIDATHFVRELSGVL
jgi:CheY-like chemotaxis protein